MAVERRRSARNADAASDRSELTRSLFDFFYPVHYKLGMIFELLMRDGRLTRKQLTVLWMIQVLHDDDGRLPRKRLEAALLEWFEMLGPAVSSVLKELSSPPLEFVVVATSASSRRERVVSLTPAGAAFIARVDELGFQRFSRLVETMPDELMEQGARYLAALSQRLDETGGRADGAGGD